MKNPNFVIFRNCLYFYNKRQLKSRYASETFSRYEIEINKRKENIYINIIKTHYSFLVLATQEIII